MALEEGFSAALTLEEKENESVRKNVLAELRNPSKCEFTTVTKNFKDADSYWKVMGKNARAEYYHVFKDLTSLKHIKTKSQFTFTTKATSKRLGMTLANGKSPANLPGEGVRFQLLHIKEAQPDYVSGPGKPNDDPDDIYISVVGNDPCGTIEVYPPLRERYGSEGEKTKLKVRFLGYVGSFKVLLHTLYAKPSPKLLPMILDPKTVLEGSYGEEMCPEGGGANESQLLAINGLKNAIEIVHGPPGTGKSTTISKMVKYRVPPNKRALITSSRNKAIDSICEKFEKEGMLCIVEGNAHRMGDIAVRHTLEFQTLHEKRVLKARSSIEQAKEEVDRLVNRLQRPGLVFGRKPIQNELESWQKIMFERIEELVDLQNLVRDEILLNCRAYICTIGSIGKLMSTHEGLKVHTVFIDEAGSTSEIAMASILRLHPENIVLIGDHCQLPPLVLGNDPSASKKFVDRSMMERLVAAGCENTMLTIQYRMNPEIAQLVSGMMYRGKLTTAEEIVNRPHKKTSGETICWVDHYMPETMDEKTKSISNPEEAKLVLKEYKRERAVMRDRSFMIITPYKAQVRVLEELFKSVNDSQLRIVTVDGSQGSEADIVIVSCVRCNRTSEVGFTSDTRRINVALSRAREGIVIVGSRTTMIGRSARRRRSYKASVGDKRRPSCPTVGVNGFTCGFNITKNSVWGGLGGRKTDNSGGVDAKIRPPSPHRVAGLSWKGWNGVIKYIEYIQGWAASSNKEQAAEGEAKDRGRRIPAMGNLEEEG